MKARQETHCIVHFPKQSLVSVMKIKKQFTGKLICYYSSLVPTDKSKFVT